MITESWVESLCSTAGSHWPIIPDFSVYMPIPNPQSISPRSVATICGNYKFFEVCKSVSVLQISSFVFFFCFFFFLIYLFFIFCLFTASPVAYGDSQARGPTGAVAASLHHSHVCDLHHRSQQRWILNLLSEARD